MGIFFNQRRGLQLEPDLSEEVSARLRLGSGSNGLLRRKMSILETKEKNCGNPDHQHTPTAHQPPHNKFRGNPSDQLPERECTMRFSRTRIQNGASIRSPDNSITGSAGQTSSAPRLSSKVRKQKTAISPPDGLQSPDIQDNHTRNSTNQNVRPRKTKFSQFHHKTFYSGSPDFSAAKYIPRNIA